MRKMTKKIQNVLLVALLVPAMSVQTFAHVTMAEGSDEIIAFDCTQYTPEEAALLYGGCDFEEETDNEFATSTLLLEADNKDFDRLGASRQMELGAGKYALSYPDSGAAKKAYHCYQLMKGITWVEPDIIVEIGSQTSFEKEVHGGDLKSEEILSTESNLGPEYVMVALLDTGIDKANQTINQYIIDSGQNLSTSGEPNDIGDDNGHGTQMAKLILAGQVENVRVLPFKIANANGKATILNTYLAIMYAIESGVSVIHISLNTNAENDTSKLLEQAINTATELGIHVVISAGNSSKDTAGVVPANIPSAIVVSAVDEYQEFASYSNYGTLVDYCALGKYGEEEGTSYAAARVSGRIAELLSEGKQDVITELNEQAVDLGDTGKDNWYGNGLIYTEGDVFLEKAEEEAVDNTEHGMETDQNDSVEDKYVLQEDIINLSWQELDAEQLDSYLINSDAYYVGYFLNALSTEELEEIKLKSDVLFNEVIVSNLAAATDNEDKYKIESEEKLPLWEYALKTYQTDSQYLSTSDWYIESGGAFYISSSDRKNVYKYQLSSLKNVTRVEQYTPGFTMIENATVKITRTTVREASSAVAFTAPAVDGTIEKVITMARAHEVKFTPTDKSIAPETVYAYAHIVTGNDDGRYMKDLAVNFKSYAQSKIGYHTAYNDVDTFKWDSSATLSQNYASTTQAMWKSYNDGTNGNQSISDKALVAGKFDIWYNGVYLPKYSYSATNEATWDRKRLDPDSEAHKVLSGYRAMGEHTISDASSKFTLLLNLYQSAGWVNYAAGVKMYEADIPNYIMNLVPNTYTITYNANGGTGTMSSTSATYDTATALRDNNNKFTKTGYTFAGWSKTKTGGVAYKNKAEVLNLTSANKETVTLYAVWTPNVYTITLDKQGGSGGTSAYYEKYDTGNYTTSGCTIAITTATFPTKSGYVCQGYYSSINGGGTCYVNASGTILSGKTAFTANTLLYAFWKPLTYYVAYNGNGSTTGSMSKSTHTYGNYLNERLTSNGYIRRFTVDYQGNAGKINNISNLVDSYTQTVTATFKEWCTAATSTGTKYANGAQLTSNLSSTSGETVNLYAQWTDSQITLPSGTRDGYDLLGWSKTKTATTPDAGYTVGSKITITDNATLYAVWKLKSYTIKYDANGGTGTMAAEIKSHFGGYKIAENKFNRDGYDFVGWSIDPNLDYLEQEPEYQPGDFYSIEESMTLYAIWAQRFNVAYIGNEQSLGVDFIDSGDEELGIAQADTYTFSGNIDDEEQEIFSKEKRVSYTDDETGEEVQEDISCTVVGWTMTPDAGSEWSSIKLNQLTDSKEVYKAATSIDAITYGTPAEDYGTNSHDRADIVFYGQGNVKAAVSNLSDDITPYVNLYAIWDDGPIVKGYDLYYTLDFAKSTTDTNGITVDEILRTVEIEDKEDTDVIKIGLIPEDNEKVEGATYATISDYSANDFAAFEHDGSVNVNLQAVDSVGNITNKQITIHIVDSTLYKSNFHQYTRFIDEKYYNLSYEQGGLHPDSRWLTDEAYKTTIQTTFSNIINSKPEKTYEFTREEVLHMQEFVTDNGIGNSLNSDALSRFVATFM